MSDLAVNWVDYRPPYRGQCANCLGPIAVFEHKDGAEAISICPACSRLNELPHLIERIAALPTATFNEHAKKCLACASGGICDIGLERMDDYPRYAGARQ